MYQTELLILLAVLVVVLSILLVTRIQREKRQMASIRAMSLSDFSDFLRSNSVGGTIQVVAGKVSDFLKNAFGCEKIVFLRKQRGFLELNYYHGIRGFNRTDFRIRYDKGLVERLQESPMPRPITDLEEYLAGSCYSKLQSLDIDICFPIFWRSNLYGIYFVKSNLEIKSRTFNILIAGLAQSLSAAYHIKWHESRYEKLEQKAVAQTENTEEPDMKWQPSRQILRLVRHRKSESLVPRIIDSARRDLGLTRVLFVYEPKTKGEPLLHFSSGGAGNIDVPRQESFDALYQAMDGVEVRPVDELTTKESKDRNLVNQIKKAGMKYMARFQLTDRRNGLLAWESTGSPAVTARRLSSLQFQARELMENAESYERIEELSYTDNLTGLSNQRYFRKRLVEEIDRAKRYKRSMALIIFDMDDLKGINDNFGHLAGDAVLKRLGQILKRSIRAIDIIARYGGDEFCVIMPEADAPTCERFMVRLQQKISSCKFTINESQEDIQRTISLGGAVYPDHGEDHESLLMAADSALLRAKEDGRNRHLLFDPEKFPETV